MRKISLILILFSTLMACQAKPRRVVVGVGLTENYHAAVRMAAQEINASGGIQGVPLELFGLEWPMRADGLDSPSVLTWAHRFADQKDLVAVIGHSDSTSTLSAAAFYNQRDVPQIVTTATHSAITNIGSWTYRLCISDAAQGPALAEYAVKDWNKKHLALFYVNNDYGRGLAHAFEQRARALGAEIVSSVMLRNNLEPEDQQLIRSLLISMKKSKTPDLFVLFHGEEAALGIIQAIRGAGLSTDLLGSDSLSPITFIHNDPGLLAGMRISQFFLPREENRRSMEFIENARRYTGKEPEYREAFAYDAVYLVRDAIQQGGFSRKGVKYYLDHIIREQTVIHGAAGDLVLRPDHDARRDIYIVEIRNGKHKPLKTISVN